MRWGLGKAPAGARDESHTTSVEELPTIRRETMQLVWQAVSQGRQQPVRFFMYDILLCGPTDQFRA